MISAPLQRRIWEEADAFIAIWSPENSREGPDLDQERKAALELASAPMRERTMSMSAPWVIAEYPVMSGAQDAGMTLPQYEQFIFDSVLLDWAYQIDPGNRELKVQPPPVTIGPAASSN